MIGHIRREKLLIGKKGTPSLFPWALESRYLCGAKRNPTGTEINLFLRFNLVYTVTS